MNKVYAVTDFPGQYAGTYATIVVVAKDEEEAHYMVRREIIADANLSITDRFGMPHEYTLTPVKLTKPSALILSYGSD